MIPANDSDTGLRRELDGGGGGAPAASGVLGSRGWWGIRRAPAGKARVHGSVAPQIRQLRQTSCGRPNPAAAADQPTSLCVLVRSAGAHACWLSLLSGAGAAQDKDENTLAKAYFRWNAEGWNATTKDGESWPSSGELGYLKSSDDDDSLWYYTASPDFLGETFCCALCGRAPTFEVRAGRLRPGADRCRYAGVSWSASLALNLLVAASFWQATR